jgi:hypothetical protein
MLITRRAVSVPAFAFGLGTVLLTSAYVGPHEHTFANPPMLYSHDGKLHVDVVAAPASYTVAGRRFQGMPSRDGRFGRPARRPD